MEERRRGERIEENVPMGTRECNCVAHVGDYQKRQGGSDVQNRLKGVVFNRAFKFKRCLHSEQRSETEEHEPFLCGN